MLIIIVSYRICRYFAIFSIMVLASKAPGTILPSGKIIAGVPEIPSFWASLMFSSITVVSHFGLGSGFFSNASSKSARDFSHTMAFALSYASLCMGKGYILI